MVTSFNANASDAVNLCKQAVYLGGGNEAYAYGFCNGASQSASYWQFIVNAIYQSGERGYSNDDVARVITYATGFGGC